MSELSEPLPAPARARVSVNLALSLDGKISSAAGRPSGWTSRADHERLLELRRGADALLVGRATLEADRMTMRVPGQERQPLRCIASRSGRIAADHPLWDAPGGPIHCLVGEQAEEADLDSLRARGAVVMRADLRELPSLLHARHGVRRLHCEGGGEIVRALAEADLIDDLHLTWAGHRLFGGLRAATATGLPGDFLPASLRFECSGMRVLESEGECLLSYRRVR